MSLRTLIEESNELLDSSRLDLEALLAAVDEKREEIANLEDELHGLRLAASRRGELEDQEPELDANVVPIAAGVTLPGGKAADLSSLSRSDAVAHVLSMTDRPIDRSAILTRLQTLGRVGDTLDQISLALTNLKRSGRAVRIGNGRWRAVLNTAHGNS